MAITIKPPPSPAGFVPDEFFAGIHWHQRWELFEGVFTPGRNPVDYLWRQTGIPDDLSGKRVLDIGAWHGCFSFECERRGAAEVVAYSLEDPDKTGFNKMKAVLGSKVRYVEGSAYTMSSDELGTFDAVLFLGVLYHLRYPLLAVDRIRAVSSDLVFIETHVIDADPHLRRPFERFGCKSKVLDALGGSPLWRQYKAHELAAGDESNWFGPNSLAVIEAFESAGFECSRVNSWGDRASFRAKAVELPTRLLKASYEGMPANRSTFGLDKAPSK